MKILVVKFGGTSVADPERIGNAAKKIAREIENGFHVVAVVSAMAGVTNQLTDYCKAFGDTTKNRDFDAVLASGEQVTAGLMALALQQMGVKARSCQSWQIPIRSSADYSDARITNVEAEKLLSILQSDTVPVVTGFQGVTPEGDLTTLGRGGSDTSAVALAAVLNAVRCDIYTDVDGVYTCDPRLVKQAQKLKTVSYEEMLEMAALGAKVLHPRSVALGMKFGVPIQVLSSFEAGVGSDVPGTVITTEDSMIEEHIISGITLSRNEAKLTLAQVPDKPGIAAAVCQPIADAGVQVDMIVQSASADGKTTDMTLSVPRGDLKRAVEALRKVKDFEKLEIKTAEDIAKLSLAGIGVRNNPKVPATMFKTLSEIGVNIHAISTSEVRISVLIDEASGEKAAQALHKVFIGE
ncbi:MAG: aspartate kinase [Alphaproteobacteria bacterium]|nr:aspartate kinase [Alphaproteobacteria bacterium]